MGTSPILPVSWNWVRSAKSVATMVVFTVFLANAVADCL